MPGRRGSLARHSCCHSADGCRNAAIRVMARNSKLTARLSEIEGVAAVHVGDDGSSSESERMNLTTKSQN